MIVHGPLLTEAQELDEQQDGEREQESKRGRGRTRSQGRQEELKDKARGSTGQTGAAERAGEGAKQEQERSKSIVITWRPRRSARRKSSR